MKDETPSLVSRIEYQIVAMHRAGVYTSAWYHHMALRARLVREWRLTTSLKAV